ncbi:MAG: cyclic peptide export ABC transporter [Verrucomicrobia bacterium]|nr:cyclic peptide export ABC transporter [Verrucomicrobiota bacterium]
MEFFRFLQKESTDLDRRLIIAGVFSGIVNTILIFLLTRAGGKAVRGGADLLDLAMVGLCLWAFWKSKGYLMSRMAKIVEQIIQNVRLRLVEKIRYSDLGSIESIGRAPLYGVVSTHADTISRASVGIFSAATSVVLLLCVFIIIFLLSRVAFLIVIGTLALMIFILQLNQAKAMAGAAEIIKADNAFVKGFGDLVDGFKELKMDSEKNREFANDRLKPLAASAKQQRVHARLIFNRTILLIASAMFILLAAIVFLVPVLSPAQASAIVGVTALIVFMFGPLGEVVAVYPLFNEALAAIREIQRIEQNLDSVYESGLADPVAGTDSELTFDTIRCDQMAFSYRDESGRVSFSLEPFDFQVSKGEIVFITGGNGSGKSTFLKVLAGLYPASSGAITVDHVSIGPMNRQSYRNLFSAIFSDFHLFDRVYGINEVDEARLGELLAMADLTQKTGIVDRQITTINLSTGQRKRLALVLALLEDKEIVLLDEWAAEQDPQFRRKFYREILPGLKQHGKTVIAITHDDDHYDVADRVLKMQFGKFVPS